MYFVEPLYCNGFYMILHIFRPLFHFSTYFGTPLALALGHFYSCTNTDSFLLFVHVNVKLHFYSHVKPVHPYFSKFIFCKTYILRKCLSNFVDFKRLHK